MNFTLFSLSLANFSLTSPLLSPSFHSFSSLKTQTYSKLYISHSAQSFLFMKPYLSSLLHKQQTSISFTNSHFMYFLHSTISISDQSSQDKDRAKQLSNSDDNYKPRVFNREKIESTIYSNEDVVLKAINCFFIECTEPISGGAIDMLCEESSLYITKCCFVSCFAQNQGGAISFFGNLIRVNDTCFDGCYTMDSSMAMEIYVKGSREKVLLTRLSITKCADKKLFNSKREDRKVDRMHFDDMGQFGVYISNIIDINRGKQKLKAINSTNNIVHLTGGFCYSDESISFSLSYSTIVNNIADTLFNLYDIIPNNGNVSYCNVLNNTGSLSLTIFDLENSTVDVSSCTFLQNNLSFLASSGTLHFENCAYDFNSKNPPLENADFSEVGSIFHKLKNWRSAKTVVFDKEQIENNAVIFERCRKNKPRNSRNEEFVNNRFNNNFDKYRNDDYFDDNNNNDNEYKNKGDNNKDEDEDNVKIKKKNKDDDNDNDDDNKNRYKNNKNDDDYDREDKKRNKNNDVDDREEKKRNRNNDDDDREYKRRNKNNDNDDREDRRRNKNNNDDDREDKKWNKNDDDNDDMNIFNNKNGNNNNRNNKNDDDEDEDNLKIKNKNKFINNQIQIADNEDEEEGDANNKHNDKLSNETPYHQSRNGLLFMIIGMLFLGIAIGVFYYFIKNRERDMNQLQDVELL